MTDIHERICVGCGDTEEMARLENCSICRRWYCPDCAHRAGFGRKFCSVECSRAYYFAGELDDDESASDE
ncbi:MAG TPA: hypothetical protein VHK90_02165 [Thermoanaerobaculia bacterium]|nr:hypothetical protein [Thermoanaerobaculia bacterium]